MVSNYEYYSSTNTSEQRQRYVPWNVPSSFRGHRAELSLYELKNTAENRYVPLTEILSADVGVKHVHSQRSFPFKSNRIKYLYVALYRLYTYPLNRNILQ